MIKLYNRRKAGIISKEVADLKVGDLLEVVKIEDDSILHLEKKEADD